MKGKVSFWLLILILLSGVSCGEDSDDDPTEKEEEEQIVEVDCSDFRRGDWEEYEELQEIADAVGEAESAYNNEATSENCAAYASAIEDYLEVIGNYWDSCYSDAEISYEEFAESLRYDCSD